jgi:hypothetical protein
MDTKFLSENLKRTLENAKRREKDNIKMHAELKKQCRGCRLESSGLR